MGPLKKKESVRRQILDLNTTEDSPSRPTWQTKYQHVLHSSEVHENGDSVSSPSSPSIKNNPLSGLLSSYTSDSESEETSLQTDSTLNSKVEDFLKEIHSISTETANYVPANHAKLLPDQRKEIEKKQSYSSSTSAWQQCYDHNSGYPYYWNTETNEVTWEMPEDFKSVNEGMTSKQQLFSSKEPLFKEVNKKGKHSWQTESESENEMVVNNLNEKTLLKSIYGNDSSRENQNIQKSDNFKKHDQVPSSEVLPSCTDSAKTSDLISILSEDPEGLNEHIFETSSLLAHGVQDTGPPGDDNFESNKEPILKNDSDKSYKKTVPLSCDHKNNIQSIEEKGNEESSEKTLEKINGESDVNTSRKCNIADFVIAEIERETPPDYSSNKKSRCELQNNDTENSVFVSKSKQNSTNFSVSSIALIANYGDDSEPEENSYSEKTKSNVNTVRKESSPSIFPIESTCLNELKVKQLFPNVESGMAKICSDNKDFSSDGNEAVGNLYNADIEVNHETSHKAFKRKRRLELAPVYGPSTSKILDEKSFTLEQLNSPATQYNMDPNLNEHRGFGYSVLNYEKLATTDKKSYKNFCGIHFIKAETLNLNKSTEVKEKQKNEDKSAPDNTLLKPVETEEIEDAATLLREKVKFLTQGSNEISPIKHMAIELETLYLAWQQGALTPAYMLQWANEKCAELIRHEKTAAPSGWTCLWDRKNKRYFYRNTTTKTVQLEYPSLEETVINPGKEDGEGDGDEMDICDTPPHLSSLEPEKQTDERPTLLQCVTQSISESSKSPVPRSVSFEGSFDLEDETVTNNSKINKKNGRKIIEISQRKDGEEEQISTSSTSILTSSLTTTAASELTTNNTEVAPPLPPVPPPPPPPPEESPPPLPNSPPPMSLDPDQPLPPGVDEPEYSLYRRTSPKNSYKKTQTDSGTYSTDLMMTYGYALPVQQVVSPSGQAVAMQIQPLEYHTYMHEAVSNPYIVQSPPTTHVIQCSAKKSKLSLNSELMSFYSDLAMLDAPTESTGNANQLSSKPAQAQEPSGFSLSTVPDILDTSVTVTTTINSSTVASMKPVENLTTNGVNVKKKKKAKATSGLSLKKKSVSSLVAKWQQVQEEVRRNFSDDDDIDDDTQSTK